MARIMTIMLLMGNVALSGAALLEAERWSGHPDGGTPPAISAVEDGLRFDYRPQGANNWGNARLDGFTLQPHHTGIRFEVLVEEAEDAAAMHLWLFEADGDAWMTRVVFEDGHGLPSVKGQWRQAHVAFGMLNYQPRGDGRRDFMSVNRLLLGLNFGRVSVRVRNLRLEGVESRPVALRRSLASDWRHPGERGRRVGVFCEEGLHGARGVALARRLESRLTAAGYPAVLLGAGDVADATILNREALDLLVLPEAAPFPAAAQETLRQFLKGGGRFLALGGYPFDRLLTRTEQGWQRIGQGVVAAEVGKAVTQGLNTRYGQPGDTMRLSPEQLGVCDPSFLLRHAVRLVTASDQAWVTERLEVPGAFEGPAAVTMTGSNNPVFPNVWGRSVTLLETQDAYGRPRGPAATVVLNHAGPYAGSAWGLVTPDCSDWLAGGQPQLERVLLTMVGRLLSTSYLVGTDSDHPAVSPGETVRLSASVHVEGAGEAEVRFLVDGRPVGTARVSGTGRVRRTADGVPYEVPSGTEASFAEVTVELWQDGRRQDVMRSGLVIRQRRSEQAGVSIALRDNYFELNGRPTFFAGVNTTGMMWYSANENPLVWRRDFASMRDHAMNTLRILHFSPFCRVPGAYSHRSTDLRAHPRRTIDQTDAIVQLAQENQVMVFLSLHDWLPLDESDESLAAQAEWNRFWVSRYAQVPGMLYDIQNEPSTSLKNTAVLMPLFERFLTERHGSVAAAQAAWAASGAGTELTLAPPSCGWRDLRLRDVEQFRAWVFLRWTKANMAGIKAGNPKALGTVGYLQNLHASDKHLGTQAQDFANVHHYGELGNLRAVLKLMDRRWSGRSLSLGEFGSRVAHQARNNGFWGDPAEASIRHYLGVGHSVLGMGGSFLAAWSWKDFQDCVFPWGINHADLTAKPVLEAYRNMMLTFRTLRPVYEPPQTYLVVPDGFRFGDGTAAIHEAIRRSADALLRCNVPFSVISEWTLDELPAEATTLVWPLCYGAKDETFERVAAWVGRGGRLLLTGDPRFGYARQPDRLDRLSRLGLATALPPLPPDTPSSADASTPLLSGDGRVLWLPEPIELRDPGDQRLRELYRRFLDEVARTPRLRTVPDDGQLLLFQQRTADGMALVAVNASVEARRVELPAMGARPSVSLEVAAGRTGFVQFSGRQVVALNCQGELRVDGATVCSGNRDVAVLALDGRDVRVSGMRLLAPYALGAAHGVASVPGLRREAGEFRHGRWTVLTAQPQDDDAALALDLRLEATEALLPEARRRLEALLKMSWEQDGSGVKQSDKDSKR